MVTQHVGNLGRGLKRHRQLLSDRVEESQHVGNLGRGLKHFIYDDGGIVVLSTSETSEGD